MNKNARRYIKLMKNVLTDFHRMEWGEYKPIRQETLSWKTKGLAVLDGILSLKGFSVCRKVNFNLEKRMNGLDWPTYGDTMIGMKRLENLEFCIEKVIIEKIPGDLIETGVWRGGATIFMRAMLEAMEEKQRIVWVADSFEGLPKPNKEKYAADEFDTHYKMKELAISIENVKKNFQKYDLLDDQVRFLKGWFKDTLPVAPIKALAVVRLDGDMYESTMDGLVNLYPKLSVGGYIIIDDWNAVAGCKMAVNDYRAKHGITEPIVDIDRTSAFWRKETAIPN